ncbi:redox-regulated ATPase YchF [Candidatus Woesearchaeota archaeon]|nr:redox-regulated ATPase YchF [Candidatus Woesearchaeota archaeon]
MMLIGVVGKPSVGKSTFFKAATLAEVDIANYPFTTIKPNSGVGYVKVECVDKDFNAQCNPRVGFCINHQRFVPVQLIDVAGLVPGAHEGLGMGNQFLDDLRQAHALIHVIDVAGSTNEKGESIPPGSYDPANDIRFLEEELDMWYLGILKKGWERFARQIMQEKSQVSRALAKQLSGLGVDEKMIEAVIKKLSLNAEKPDQWSQEQLKGIATELRRITKPTVIACNKIDMPSGKENFERLKQEFPDYILVPCSAESELVLRLAAKNEIIEYVPGDPDFKITHPEKVNEKQSAALDFVKKNILEVFNTTGVQEVLDTAVFKLLKYIAIFPGGVNKLADKDGNVLPDCFLLPYKSTALDFAFAVHTDFGKNFIRAIDVKTKRTVGKEHELKHRDVVEIVSGK